MTTEKRELTPQETEILARLIAQKYVELERERHKKFMAKVRYDLFTPYLIKLYHKLTNQKPWDYENL